MVGRAHRKSSDYLMNKFGFSVATLAAPPISLYRNPSGFFQLFQTCSASDPGGCNVLHPARIPKAKMNSIFFKIQPGSTYPE